MGLPDTATQYCVDEFARAAGVDFPFSFAFQPIVDAASREVFSFEALVRGPNGESSAEVFARVPQENLYRFDQACRLKAIHVAKRLHIKSRLNLNLLPNSIHGTGMNVRATLEASVQEGFPADMLVFEVSESELLQHYARIEGVFDDQQGYGFRTAIDDFGTGYSGLRMLAEYQPDFIKLDRNLIADIHRRRVKQIIVKGIHGICRQLHIDAIAEGVETAQEYRWLRADGIRLFQGYYFGRPVFEALTGVQQGLF